MTKIAKKLKKYKTLNDKKYISLNVSKVLKSENDPINNKNNGDNTKNTKYKCPLCNNPSKFYSNSSSYGKHLRTFHGQKWECNYCHRKYTDKVSHPFCKVKQKKLLKRFTQSFLEKNDPISFPSKNIIPQFGNNCIEKGPFIYFNNYILGTGHFSKCFYGIDTLSGSEVAIKFALNKKKMIDYKDEGIIINKLNDKNFYPKLYNFNSDNTKEFLSMTLMGPDLLKLVNFTKKKYFEQKTIKNIGIELINVLEYLHFNNIIHRDIKPNNIVWGVYSNNNILNQNNLYLIDFGISEYIGKAFLNEQKISLGTKGTTSFISINSHLKGKPNPKDDIEMLVYTLLFLTDKGLPWQNLDTGKNFTNNDILKMKVQFDFYSWCEKEYEFLGDILEYLKIINEEKASVNYNVIRNLFKINAYEENGVMENTSKFSFVDEIKQEISNKLKIKNNILFENDKLNELFGGYPIEYCKFYKNLINGQ